ncbi:MAG: hypothetical protein A2Y88_01240 [Chloroflexi bacterium RBG_13_48_10]|nr:MAG: hypothetical protein A2Y88_01240 [Chloroflexi bacterium RBG_13_48_10]
MSTTDPFITIFTAPKPFTDPHINLIQRNAIQSWLHLADDVQVLIIGNEAGMSDFAAETGVSQLQDVSCNEQGTPLVNSIFKLARQNSTSPILAYVNADILLTSEFVSLARQVADQTQEFLIVGQRWDLDLKKALVFTQDWDVRLLFDVKTCGRLHPPGGSDYFIFPRNCFTEVPSFAIGRAGWDNWMFYHARVNYWPVVDVSSSLTVIHQDHDYSHLPGGQPHYHMPESFENIRLAGGRRTIFTLLDANYIFQAGKLVRIPLRGRHFWRNLETYPLMQWHSYPLAELTFALLHPIKAFGEWRGRLAYKINTNRHS